MNTAEWLQFALAAAGGAGSVALGLIRYFNNRIDQGDRDLNARFEQNARDRHDMRDEISRVAGDLAHFREVVSKNYPSYERMSEMLRPISDGINELKGDMRDLFAKIDRKADKS
jgi:predicted nuclease with TOPRIM domain